MTGAKLTPKIRAKLLAFQGTHMDAAKACGVGRTMASRVRRENGITGREVERWPQGEIESILALRAQEKTIAEIAAIKGRTERSVKAKLSELRATLAPSAPVVVAPWVARALSQFIKQGYTCEKTTQKTQ